MLFIIPKFSKSKYYCKPVIHYSIFACIYHDVDFKNPIFKTNIYFFRAHYWFSLVMGLFWGGALSYCTSCWGWQSRYRLGIDNTQGGIEIRELRYPSSIFLPASIVIVAKPKFLLWNKRWLEKRAASKQFGATPSSMTNSWRIY